VIGAVETERFKHSQRLAALDPLGEPTTVLVAVSITDTVPVVAPFVTYTLCRPG
jgi:hypothetical protein